MRSSPVLASLFLISSVVSCVADDPSTDPQQLALADELGVPVDVLGAVPEVPGGDLRGAAEVLAACATARDVVGDDLGAWAPALDCFDELQLELAEVQHAHGGVVRAANELAWDDDVSLAIPVKGGGDALTSCASGKFCFYENRDFGGRRLTFGGLGFQYFDDYGFRDRASSWKNRTTTTVRVYNERRIDHVLGTLWVEAGLTQSAYVGSSSNDKADQFYRSAR